jgi:hypothetical protein
LIDTKEICKGRANRILTDETEFSDFIASKQKSLITAEFVLMLIIIDGSHRAFPICHISATHGKATRDTMEKIIEKRTFLENAGIQIVGLATDGDLQYISITLEFMNSIIDEIYERANQTLLGILEDLGENCHFSDPFHLVKRDRYRKVSKDHFIVDPWNEASMYSVSDLIGLGIPDYILGAEQARKMEDLLPLKLFSLETLRLVLDTNDPGLFFAMLPSTLLLESIHSESLSRKQRIDYLMIGASLMVLYEFYKKIYQRIQRHFERSWYSSNPRGEDMFSHKMV